MSGMFKLKIIHKGLLILLLPFAVQITLFVLLFVLNESAEVATQQERYRYKFLQRINVMMEDSGIAWGSIINRLFTVKNLNRGSQISPTQYRSMTDAQMRELKEIPLESENRKDILMITEQMITLQANMLDALEANRDSFGTVENLPLLMKKVKELHDSFYLSRKQFQEIKRLLLLEQNKLDEAIARESERRAWTKTLLIADFVGQLLLTGGLLLLLLKNITSRLNRLVHNAHVLPTLEPLRERVTGDDEIAYMDAVLHDASESLIAAAQNRQSIMNMIAHDIRSPLMSSNLLLDKLKDEVASQNAANAGGTANRLKTTFSQVFLLVEDLLTLDKYEAGEIELDLDMIALQELVAEAVETVRPQAEKRGITIISDVAPGEVVADRGRLLQVLNNLLSNAIRFSPDREVIKVSGKVEAEKATVAVTDRGKGIAVADLPHVFERFYQSAGTKQGFGLGLAICKMIIDSHGGRIGAESATDSGSTFWFTLPVDA